MASYSFQHPNVAVKPNAPSLTPVAIKRAFLDNLFYVQGKFPALATRNDYYMALAYAVRDRMLQRWISTATAYTKQGSRTVCYLSAEFLVGPHLGNNLINLGIEEAVKRVVTELGLDFDELLQTEEEPGLGNGGLGRLAACYLDSLASQEIPSLGYGIRYEFGIFDQAIVDGWQVEKTDKWLRFGNPWEIARPEWAVEVKFGGHTERYTDEHGRQRSALGARQDRQRHSLRHADPGLSQQYRQHAAAVARGGAGVLRFLGVQPRRLLRRGQQKIVSENLSKVLYPNDEPIQGKELRLEQQFFFVSCSLQDMLRIMRGQKIPLSRFHEKFAVQLNDTHPAIAIAELMRLLVDEYGMDWATAWDITRRTFGYTNHTLLPEALERWPLAIFARVLPRHLEIIYEINARFLDEVRMRFLGDEARIARLSLIDESGERYVRMAHLACVGSHTINGVARTAFAIIAAGRAQGFSCPVAGKIPQRHQRRHAAPLDGADQPATCRAITEAIGERWLKDLEQLHAMEPLAEDGVSAICGAESSTPTNTTSPASSAADRHPHRSRFPVSTSRSSAFTSTSASISTCCTSSRCTTASNPIRISTMQPRTFIFGGKAAPGYHFAKLIIKLINAVGDVVNRDPGIRDMLKVVFLPNYNVTNGQRVYPAADLSEQISTAGKEASGTGNMKFSMNGALTIGTLDGANMEILDEVGKENFFLFGLTTPEVYALKAQSYRPWEYYHGNPELREVIELLRGGFFSRGDTELFRPLIDGLLRSDPYLVMADFQAYADCQRQVSQAYGDSEHWARMSILNTVHSGKFSSDRSIREYCDTIWKAAAVPIKLLSQADVKVGVIQ